MANIVEFECIPEICSYNSEQFKVYGTRVELSKYPNIQLNKYNNVSISGNFHTLAIGCEYQVKAEEVDGKHGVGYKVLNIKRDKPQTLEASRKFLSEILTYHQVESLLNAYPDIIDRVIKNKLNDIDLNKTPHIKEVTFEKIKNKITENFCLIELVDKFQGLLDISILRKLHEKYPSTQKIESELKRDPYKCLCGLARTGFKTADSILLELDKTSKRFIKEGKEPIIDFGFDLKTSKQRKKACVMFCLEKHQNDGHTKMDEKELRLKCKTLAPACIDHFVDVVKNDEHLYFDIKSKFVALKSSYETELYIATRIIEALVQNEIWDFDLSEYKNKGLTDEQFSLMPCVCNNNILILKGAAGTGKSYTIITLLKMLNDNKKSYRLFSPTGRAAKVLGSYCNEEAYTIHRGLCYRPPNEWGYNENHPLVCDVLIVDEGSMVDIFIMQRLLKAIDFKRTKLLIIGDSDQIPSVSCGNVLHNMITSQIIPMVILTTVFRYGIGGLDTIATNTREGKKFLKDTGKVEIFGEDKGYIFIPTSQENIIKKLMQLYKKLLDDGYKPEDIWVLSAYNKGEYGTLNINSKLQRLANLKSMMTKGLIVGDITFYKDDLVAQTINNYKAKIYKGFNTGFDDSDEDANVFVPNGEIGKVIEITDKNIIINFDDKNIIYDKRDAHQLKLAYSISNHRSQGGQTNIIIILTPSAHVYFLNSNLIYEGQTRSKKVCYHLGDVKTVNIAIKKKVNFNRNTFLTELLKNGINHLKKS